MSLQVWLPFNNNINNQGVTGAVTQVTAPTYVNGKIGKAMSTGSVTIPAATAAKFYNNKAMSFCFWIYTLANSSIGTPIIGQSAMAAGDNRMFSIYQYPTSADLHLSWQNETATGTFLSGIWTGYMPNNTWTHITITYDGSTAKIYQNGAYKASASGTSARSNFSYNVPIPNCAYRYLNDLRIYDEVLSEKQIKEISKGLVCHYPLDNNGSGMPNLVNGSNTNSVDTNGFGYSEQTGGSTRTIDYDGGIPCVKITRNSTAHSGWDYFWYNKLQVSNLKINTTYTISFDAIGSGSGTIGLSGFLQGNGTNSLTQSVTTVSNSFNSNGWSHIHFITTTKASFDGISVSGQVVYMSCSFLRTVNTWIKLKNIRVTEGSNESPWSPSVSDASYSIFNINGNKEIDISGYGNHGTKSGSLTTNSDTPKYSVGTYFPSGSGIFAHPNINLTAFTISFWAKHTATGRMVFGSSSEASSTDRNWYWYGDNSFKYPDGEFYYQHNAGSAESLLNKWTHFVAVYNGSTITVYRNSVNEGNQAASGTKTLNYLSVGIGYGSSGYWENSTMSDFRLYATALSADDVKELYQVSASIDTKGNIIGYDFQEG